jgi:anaerobic dimethyl sulfoxide reductase subunit B (iron-sulfur subunit)
MAAQYGFFVDSATCTGCKTCQLACKDYKNLSREVNFRRVYEYTGGAWQAAGETWINNVFSYYLSISCNHCEDPACTRVCPTGAMHKRSADGIVALNEDICIGCMSCRMACPYVAPQYDPVKGHMTKCNGCYERLAVGAEPVCVEACPLRALEFGPIDELRAKYGSQASVAPLPDAKYTTPSLVINPSRNARPSSDQSGFLGNPKEV